MTYQTILIAIAFLLLQSCKEETPIIETKTIENITLRDEYTIVGKKII